MLRSQSKESCKPFPPKVIHPLLIDVVIHRIFKYLTASAQEIAGLRSVCRAWHEALLQSWRESACLTLYQSPDKECEELATRPSYMDILFIQKFLQLWNEDKCELRSKPFRNYKFKHWILESIEESERSLWDHIGPITEHLHVDQCKADTYLATIFFEGVLTSFPELKTLTLTGNKFPSMGAGEMSDQQFTESLHQAKVAGEGRRHLSLKKIVANNTLPFRFSWYEPRFPNLEEVSMSQDELVMIGCYERYTSGTSPVIRKIDCLLCDERRCVNAARILMRRTMLGYPASVTSLAVGVSDIPDVDIFLGPYVDTLKSLKLYRKPFEGRTWGFEPYSFGRDMPALEEIHLWGPVTNNFRFLLKMPKLRKVHVNQNCDEMWENLQPDLDSGGRASRISTGDMISASGPEIMEMKISMEFLQHLHVDTKFSEESLLTLGKIARNLTELHLAVSSNSIFQLISSSWRNLQELQLLYESDVDDDGIIAMASLLSINLQTENYLKRFTLETYCNGSKLTDRSVHDGFLKMASLIFLRVCVSPEMSENAEELFVGNVPNVILIRNYGEGPHGDCCRRKYFDERMQSIM